MYYFEIKSFLKEHSHIEQIYAEFHSKSHICQNKVGVSFPYQNNGILNAIRFFSNDADILRALKFSEVFLDLSDNDCFLVTNIKEVPENAIPFQLKRCRIDNTFKFKKQKTGIVTSTRNIFKDGELKEVFYLKINSKSTNQMFSIFYTYNKVEENKNLGLFSSYGFAKDNSYVYHF